MQFTVPGCAHPIKVIGYNEKHAMLCIRVQWYNNIMQKAHDAFEPLFSYMRERFIHTL